MKLPLEESCQNFALPPMKAFTKRGFDILVALALLPAILPASIILVLMARFSTGETGLFCQERIGLYGQPFTIYKIRSMRTSTLVTTNVTTGDDPRITNFGKFIRRAKMDEFPQLYNVLKGEMSFVGPRPDVEEVYQYLQQDDAKILCVRPGITGPASVLFKNEESLLKATDDAEKYNQEVVFPAKVETNLDYIENQSLMGDIRIMLKTVFG
ncbi:MAG: sugar transferase [Salaquimonas sp.]